jgi:hypothetical protein
VQRGRKSGYARSKNISSKGPLNCRSLGCARDDKGEGGVLNKHWLVDERAAGPSTSLRSGRDDKSNLGAGVLVAEQKAFLITLGGPKGP